MLCNLVKNPNEYDWKKLLKLLQYINSTQKDKLILSVYELNVIKWYIDADFELHDDFKRHDNGIMTYERGLPISQPRKQKLNTRRSNKTDFFGSRNMYTMFCGQNYL